MDTATRNRILLDNLGLARAAARRLCGRLPRRRWLDLDDAAQEAALAVIDALDAGTYDPAKGPLAAFLWRCMARRLRVVRAGGGPVRLPGWFARGARAAAGRCPQATAACHKARALGRVGLLPEHRQHRPDPAAGLLLEELRAAVARLPAKERDAVRRRFGLDGGGGATLPEVAAACGLTPQAVHSREKKALGRLREEMGGG